MEQPCYKCGQLLEEGRPFCPHCAAPQIRVVISEPAVAATTFAEAAASSEPARIIPASQSVPLLAVPLPWAQAVKPCGLAAIVSSVLMSLGLNPFVAMFSAGFLCVVFYRQGRPGLAVKASSGARLGAFGGLLCFGITALLVALAAMVPDFRGKLQEQIVGNAQKWAASHPADPQIQAALDQLKTPEGLVMMLIIGGVLLLVCSILLGSLGGALGGAIFSRRNQS